VCKDGCTGVGFELWQVQAGTIFDDIYVGDSVTEAEAFAESTFGKKKDAEKKLYDAIEEEKKAAAEKAAAEAKAKADAEAAEKKDKEAAAKEDEEDL
jgi:calreticulin